MNVKTGTSARRSCKGVDSMPCVSPDGKPTSSGMALLKSLENEPLSPSDVANKTGQPLFRVRSSIRELKNAGFIEEKADKYKLTENGKIIIQ